MHDTSMLGNECARKIHLKINYMNVSACLFPTTWCVVILLIFIGFTRVLLESKLSTQKIDDSEVNTKLSFELGELRQRINSNFVIVRAKISTVKTKRSTTSSPLTYQMILGRALYTPTYPQANFQNFSILKTISLIFWKRF